MMAVKQKLNGVNRGAMCCKQAGHPSNQHEPPCGRGCTAMHRGWAERSRYQGRGRRVRREEQDAVVAQKLAHALGQRQAALHEQALARRVQVLRHMLDQSQNDGGKRVRRHAQHQPQQLPAGTERLAVAHVVANEVRWGRRMRARKSAGIRSGARCARDST